MTWADVLWVLPLAALSLLAMLPLHKGDIPGVRFRPGPPRETPRWSAPDLFIALGAYILFQVPAALIVQLLAGGEAVAEGKVLVNLVANLVWHGLGCLAIVAIVRGARQQPLTTLGFVASPLRNALPVAVLLVLAYFPLQFISGCWYLLLNAVTGKEPEQQEPVRVFQEALERGAIADLLLLAFLAVVIAAVAEEIIFRGFIYGLLRSHAGFLPAAATSSIIFAIFHGVPALLPIFWVGLILCYVYERTGSLFHCMFFHGLFNGSQLLIQVALHVSGWEPDV